MTLTLGLPYKYRLQVRHIAFLHLHNAGQHEAEPFGHVLQMNRMDCNEVEISAAILFHSNQAFSDFVIDALNLQIQYLVVQKSCL